MSKNRKFTLSAFAILATSALLLVRYGEHWLRHLLLYLSTAVWARNLVSKLPIAWQVASRFVAGEDIDSAIQTTQQLNQKGMHVTLDYLGENVVRAGDAIEARNHIKTLLQKIDKMGADATVSIKLSQIGMRIDQDIALDNVHQLLDYAKAVGNKIRIDMEESATVDDTLNMYRNLRFNEGFDNVGVVIQSYLHRSEADVSTLIEEGASVRLCKGAYAEPADIAFSDKADTDASFVYLTQMMLDNHARENGVLLGVATHDEQMIQATIDYVKENNIPKDAFEFQMLFGVRRDLQEQLVEQGYKMRVYVPFGTAWYAYFIRRLAERPANLWFFISNFFRR
ncbi:MAG: proline dehydrogenase [Chloroflexi bacterium]|nr:proline dehydrogenase [Chloroflexota bacterium]